MGDRFEGKIIDRDIEEEMKTAYTTYAMSVIISRALPDARDGLKPSQRRILYAMKELGLEPNKKHRKCAKIAGDTSGNYHPHGEQVIYPTLVRMAQDFSMRYPLIDSQGNFGSIDGDPPAAMRYTEAKMKYASQVMMKDIEKKTVPFVTNYDETLTEPTVFPSRFPNLLCNGSTGIAVGMATNIPPHNIQDVSNALNAVLENPDISVEELIPIIKGPDFPTGGVICGQAGIYHAYTKGRGIIKLRSRIDKEINPANKREMLVVSEISYHLNKSNLIEGLVSLIQNKVITSIADIRDESGRDGLRLIIELKRGENYDVALNQLYKHSQLQTSFSINLLALINNRPKVLNLKELLYAYIDHRRHVIVARTKFDLEKAEARAHLLEGLFIALKDIDEVIRLIRSSETTQEAKNKLIEHLKLSSRQAKAILEMQLQRLTRLEYGKVEADYQNVLKMIEEFKIILASPQEIDSILKFELEEVVNKVKDERRTDIIEDDSDFSMEDLIPSQDMLVTVTHTGYIKAIPLDTYRKQHRGGRGVSAMGTSDNDFIQDMFVSNSHNYILFFTNFGKVYCQKVYQLPKGSRVAKGKAIVNLLQLEEDEKVQAYISIKAFKDSEYLIFASKKGIVKKSSIMAYSRPRKNGIIAIKIDEGDELIDVIKSNGKQEVLIATQQGLAIHFKETDIRCSGRVSRGVKGISLKKENDCVVGFVVCDQDVDILTISQKGFCKKTKMSAYRSQYRGGTGVINIKTNKKTGDVVSVKAVKEDDDIMAITANSMIIRYAVHTVRSVGRNSQGVKAINLKSNDFVVSIARVVKEELDNEILDNEILDSKE